MRPRSLLVGTFILALSPAAADWREGAGYLELADRLDRPQDGYCLDIPGSGDWTMLWAPLTAHNCKLPGLFADEAVIFDSPGAIRFPAHQVCVTAQGLRGTALPGVSLMAHPCVEEVGQYHPVIVEELQRFEHREDGRIELLGSGLCLTAGDVSDRTFSADHRWRALLLDECDQADPALSVWLPFEPRG